MPNLKYTFIILLEIHNEHKNYRINSDHFFMKIDTIQLKIDQFKYLQFFLLNLRYNCQIIPLFI